MIGVPEDALTSGIREETSTPAWVVLVVSQPCPVPWHHPGYPQRFVFCPGGLISILSVPSQSQGALAGRLRSFSMQDLRSIPDETPLHYQDPLYLEEQENRQQLLGELWGRSRRFGAPAMLVVGGAVM